MTMVATRSALVMLVLTGCATTTAAPADPTVMAPSAPPLFRLPGGARPLRYELVLDVDPAQSRVEGNIVIDVELARQTTVVWLNAGRRVRVHHAEWLVDRRVIPAAPIATDEFLGLLTGRAIPAGRAQLRITFDSEPSTGDADGFFRRKLNGRWYLFSHFEPLRARRAFPCFDEPSFKAPWSIVVRAPIAYDVLSNMPELSHAVEPDGRTRVIFRESPPLPSYLVALAVGQFRFFSSGAAGAHHTPVRVVVPETLAVNAGSAGATLLRLIELAETRLATAFPFPKLDVVTVPAFEHGAMENAGLITVDPAILDEHSGTMTQVLAHELTHQWFGDYVTCAWFDDVWLNESVAEWFGDQLASEVDSTFRFDDQVRWFRREALGEDLRARGRVIRARPRSAATIMEAFDGYTYGRGAALLRMLQDWMGQRAFDHALSRYLATHAFGTVTTADLSSALSAEAGRDLHAVLSSFLDQPGIPLIESRMICEPGEPPIVALRQRPLVPAAARSLWHIPVCASHSGRRDCTILGAEQGELTLTATGCPRVALGSPDKRLFAVRADLPANLTELTEGERRDLVLEMRQLLLVDAVAVDEVLRALPALMVGSNAPVREVVLLLSELSALVTEPQRLHWRRYLRRLGLVRRARALDEIKAQDGVSVELRNFLWSLLLSESVDPELAAEATAAAMAWLADPKRSDLRTPWLGALAGSPDCLSALAAVQGERRWIALSSLGGIQDRQQFQAAAETVLASAPAYLSTFLDNAAHTARTRQWAYQFVRQRFAAGMAGPPHAPHDPAESARREYVLKFAVSACNELGVAELSPRVSERPSPPIDFELNELAVCSSLRRAQQARALAFLASE